MKNFLTQLLLLISIVVITSCTTSQVKFPDPWKLSLDQRLAMCNAKNINKYIGNCVMQTFDKTYEPSHDEWIIFLDMQNDWNVLIEVNKELSLQYDNKSINSKIANEAFTQMILSTKDIAQYKAESKVAQAQAIRMQQAQMWLALSESLQNSNDILNGRTGSNTRSDLDTSSGMMYMLSDHYVSGTNRICIYKLGSLTATHTIQGIGLCPISKRF